MIQSAFEGGLFVKWDRESQRKKEHIIPYEPRRELTLENFGIAYVFVFFVGTFLATASFYCEIHINRKLQANPLSKNWLLLEQFFDGKRHYFKNLSENLTGKTTNFMEKKHESQTKPSLRLTIKRPIAHKHVYTRSKMFRIPANTAYGRKMIQSLRTIEIKSTDEWKQNIKQAHSVTEIQEDAKLRLSTMSKLCPLSATHLFLWKLLELPHNIRRPSL